MTTNDLIRLLRKNQALILAVAFAAATAVFLLTMNARQKFTTKALVSTGVISAFSIENPTSSGKVDRDYTLSELENLIALATAYETMEELSARLLARYLTLDKPQRSWLLPATFELVRELPLEDIPRQLQTLPDEQEVLNLINYYRTREEGNALQSLIYSDEEYFGIEFLQQQIKVYRRGNSDLLEFVYTTTDPIVCKYTLDVLIEIFMRRHAELKKNNTSRIVEYFADAAGESARRLQQAEDALLKFHTENNIINYYEQTRSIAYRKEDLDELSFKEKMVLESSRASLERIEEQLGNRARLAELNAGLIQKREELSRLSTQLAKYDLLGSGQASPAAERQRLGRQLEQVRQDIQGYTQEAFNFDQTPDGIATQNLLDEWLKLMMEAEQSQARLLAIEERQKEFEAIYGQYAPWGSQLKRIEREIGLAEGAYLEHLHSYNQAILHRENTLMASRLKVLDAPFLPQESDGQRLLFILAGFLGGAFLVSATAIGLEFLDNTLKEPRAAALQTGQEVGAALPLLAHKPLKGKKAARQQATLERSAALLAQMARFETLAVDGRPAHILATSTGQLEGKTFVSLQLAETLRKEKKRVLFLYPIQEGPARQSGMLTPAHPDNCPYLMGNDTVQKIQEDGFGWAAAPGRQLSDYDYLVMEMPALLGGWYPVDILRYFHLGLLICRANRAWAGADGQALASLKQALPCPVKLVLNGVQPDTLEAFIGETKL
ncbi:MAG: hypothetical protein J5I94_16225 [Phaeodactylibacter sp.]|nr:hypothetical protein [Phaeodactylibacter sp.]